MKKKRRKTESDENVCQNGREKEREGEALALSRTRVCVCVRVRRETRPIVIAIPTGGMFLRCAVSCRPATKPERLSSYCSLSSQQRSNRLHNLPPALLFAARHTYIHTCATHGRTLFVRA